MKKYMLFAAIAASWPGLLLPGCTGAQYQGNTNATAASTGINTGSFGGSCTFLGTTSQSPFITSATLNSDNTVTLTWNWYQSALQPAAIVVEYSLDLVSWNFLANSYNSGFGGVTSYTTPVLQPGTYIFRIGSQSSYPSNDAYFSDPSISVTISTGTTVPLTMSDPPAQVYVNTYYSITGTFPGSLSNLTGIFNQYNSNTKCYDIIIYPETELTANNQVYALAFRIAASHDYTVTIKSNTNMLNEQSETKAFFAKKLIFNLSIADCYSR